MMKNRDRIIYTAHAKSVGQEKGISSKGNKSSYLTQHRLGTVSSVNEGIFLGAA
jgi:hypothetical protein